MRSFMTQERRRLSILIPDIMWRLAIGGATVTNQKGVRSLAVNAPFQYGIWKRDISAPSNRTWKGRKRFEVCSPRNPTLRNANLERGGGVIVHTKWTASPFCKKKIKLPHPIRFILF
ncbi:hypothetical protein NPIL_165101 [Nephila pilipes]|uniref:Uncharacterized protein n=1 Tax=Nephila pilipes TaxID=299642 RepID=A0A8X6PPF7_NEPPI|nr:hypothetical protein NPIL_165101 [Nephila pilipes]